MIHEDPHVATDTVIVHVIRHLEPRPGDYTEPNRDSFVLLGAIRGPIGTTGPIGPFRTPRLLL